MGQPPGETALCAGSRARAPAGVAHHRCTAVSGSLEDNITKTGLRESKKSIKEAEFPKPRMPTGRPGGRPRARAPAPPIVMMNTVAHPFRSAFPLLVAVAAWAQQSPLVFPGGHGPGRGKQVVLISGDQEYRAEESIPALAQILASRHGFHCTVLFSVNRQTGKIDPNTIDNIPGLEALRHADLVVLFARWLELPDEQMKEIVDYTESGRPIVALRTSTHPFNYRKHPESPYAKYSYNNKEFFGGYGREVLGETWIHHYGAHQQQSTRGGISAGIERHPILRGVRDLWGESDVY